MPVQRSNRLGERGGYNLYGFIGNDGVNSWDILGLERLSLLYDFSEEAHRAGVKDVYVSINPVYDWDDALSDAQSKVEKYSKEGIDPCSCIEKLTIIGHGGYGAFFGTSPFRSTEGVSFSDADFLGFEAILDSGGYSPESIDAAFAKYPIIKYLADFSGLMCEDSEIIFVSCGIGGGGGPGERLDDYLERLFGEDSVTLPKGVVKMTPLGVPLFFPFILDKTE